MGADITLDRTQYPARIRVTDSSLGFPALSIRDDFLDVPVQLTPAIARALAEWLLAHKSRYGFETGVTGDGGRMQVSSELEVPLRRGQVDR
jgi:hypothetical protein